MRDSLLASLFGMLALLSSALAGHACRALVDGRGSAAEAVALGIALGCAFAGCCLAAKRAKTRDDG